MEKVICIIEKEQIPSLHFVENEVMSDPEKRASRNRDLYLAMLLGNNYKRKVGLVIETQTGPYLVETTVWYTGENFTVLKGGISIPVHAISEVRID